jgi:hypothetical protein
MERLSSGSFLELSNNLYSSLAGITEIRDCVISKQEWYITRISTIEHLLIVKVLDCAAVRSIKKTASTHTPTVTIYSSVSI